MSARFKIPAARAMDLANLMFFGFAAVSLCRLGWAESAFRTGIPGLMRRAAGTGNTAYYLQLTKLDPSSSIPLLRAAVAVNGRATPALLALGLALEREQRIQEARGLFERATRLDHQYAPAWVFANFCFRQNDPDGFWRWAWSATQLAFDDLRPIVELADSLDSNPARVFQRLDGGVRLERAYLDFLLARQRLDDAFVVAEAIGRRLPANGDVAGRGVRDQSVSDRARLAHFTSILIAAGRAEDALRIWTYAYPPDSDFAAFRNRVTNASFYAPLSESAPKGQGFDWTTEATAGVRAVWKQGQLHFALDGSQSDASPLVSQWLVLERRAYRLRVEYRTQGRITATGYYWHLFRGDGATASENAKSRLPANLSPALAPSEEWRTQEWRFQSGEAGLSQLRLLCLRQPGFTRVNGSLFLRRVQLEAL
jgi:tetratricopeptide (TPR) repeat protein